MFDREMDVQHFERKGKVEREAYEMQMKDREIRMKEAMAKVQLEAWDMERRGYVTRIAALEETTKGFASRLTALTYTMTERLNKVDTDADTTLKSLFTLDQRVTDTLAPETTEVTETPP
jgi:hypothetical protein